MKVAAAALASMMLVSPTESEATRPIRVTFDINITMMEGDGFPRMMDEHYSYVAIFPFQDSRVYDAGNRTYQSFLNGVSDAITSNVFSLLPLKAQAGTPWQSVAAQTDDYVEGLFKTVSFSDQRYYDAGGYLGQAVSEMFFTQVDPTRGGNGDGDRPLTFDEVASILAPGKSSRFFIFDRIYNPADSRITWTGTSTIVAFSAAPEPTTWSMMISGFGMVGGAMRRRRVSTKVSFA